MKNRFCYVIFCTIFLFLISVISCKVDKRPSANEVISAIDSAFGSVTSTVSHKTKHKSNIEIYLDGTGSVAGLIRKAKIDSLTSYETGTTSYCKFLKTLDAYLRGKQDTFQIYQFGEYSSRINKFDEALKNTFYDQRYTRLGELIEDFTSRDTGNLPKAFLVITDGIQSVAGEDDFRKVVDGVSRWLAKGLHFEILGFRSEFNGEVFCETEGGTKIGWYRSDSFGLRPFYCYVFSYERGFGKSLAQGLQANYGDSLPNMMDLSSNLFETPVIEFKTPARRAQKDINWLQPRITEGGVKYFYWKGKTNELLSGEFRTFINLNLTQESKNFKITKYGIKTIVQCINLDSNKLRIEDYPINYEVLNAVPESQPSRLEISYTIKETKNPYWLGYRFIVLPGDGTVQPPKWVENWSTQSDDQLADFSKTLSLKEFISSIMLKTKFLEQPMAVFYIAIKGRKQ